MTEALWLPVIGYEGWYEVSDQGDVRRVAGGRGAKPGRILKPGRDRSGHLMVVLSRHSEEKTFQVHRLVADAHLGPLPPDKERRHLNGDTSDNSVTNLVFGTHSENMQDAVEHGTNHNANKDRCPAGHEYSEANTKRIPSRPNARYCRACKRIDDQRAAARRRAKAAA